jgi:Ras-related C3 botulinum toxin substrate 1
LRVVRLSVGVGGASVRVRECQPSPRYAHCMLVVRTSPSAGPTSLSSSARLPQTDNQDDQDGHEGGEEIGVLFGGLDLQEGHFGDLFLLRYSPSSALQWLQFFPNQPPQISLSSSGSSSLPQPTARWFCRTELKQWRAYSEDIAAKLEAAWQSYHQQQHLSQKDKGVEEEGIDLSAKNGRVELDDQWMADIAKMHQEKLDDSKIRVPLKRLDAEGHVFLGPDHSAEYELRRGFHSMVDFSDLEMLVIFGGKRSLLLNDVWGFDYRNFNWKQLEIGGAAGSGSGGDAKQVVRPSGRIGHSAVVHSGRMWVFGGLDGLGFTCNDLWCFNPCDNANTWTKVHPEKPTKTKKKEQQAGTRIGLKAEDVGSRCHHTAVMWKDTMLIFGGLADQSTGVAAPNHVLQFDFNCNKWFQINTKGQPPCGRWGHVALVDHKLVSNVRTAGMVVVGGTTGKGCVLSDMWELDLNSWTWHQVNVTPPLPSPERCYMGGLYMRDNLYLFGGTDLASESGVFGDTLEISTGWLLDMQGMPEELALAIFSKLGLRDLCMVGGVCKRWRQISMDNSLWQGIWQRHLEVIDITTNMTARLSSPSSSSGQQQQVKTREEILAMGPAIIKAERNRQRTLDKLNAGDLNEMLETGDIIALPDVSLLPPTTSLPIHVKVLVVGDCGVGKTTVICSYTDPSYVMGSYLPTCWEQPNFNLMWNGKPISVVVWDTAAQSDYDRLRPLCYAGTTVFIVMYSVESPSSFERVRTKWVPEIQQYCPGVPWILVASKTDLLDDSTTKSNLHAKGLGFVSKEMGVSLAVELGATKFRMFSSATRNGLNAVFDAAVDTSILSPLNTGKTNKKTNCLVQ